MHIISLYLATDLSPYLLDRQVHKTGSLPPCDLFPIGCTLLLPFSRYSLSHSNLPLSCQYNRSSADDYLSFCLRIINLVPVTNVIIVAFTVMDRSNKSNNLIIIPKTERSKKIIKKNSHKNSFTYIQVRLYSCTPPTMLHPCMLSSCWRRTLHSYKVLLNLSSALRSRRQTATGRRLLLLPGVLNGDSTIKSCWRRFSTTGPDS